MNELLKYYKIVKKCIACGRNYGVDNGLYECNKDLCPKCIAKLNNKKWRWKSEDE